LAKGRQTENLSEEGGKKEKSEKRAIDPARKRRGCSVKKEEKDTQKRRGKKGGQTEGRCEKKGLKSSNENALANGGRG